MKRFLERGWLDDFVAARRFELSVLTLTVTARDRMSKAIVPRCSEFRPKSGPAAYLVHRRTTATQWEVASLFGLGHPDSASNLIRRAETLHAQSPKLRLELENIERRLTNADSRGLTP